MDLLLQHTSAEFGCHCFLVTCVQQVATGQVLLHWLWLKAVVVSTLRHGKCLQNPTAEHKLIRMHTVARASPCSQDICGLKKGKTDAERLANDSFQDLISRTVLRQA